MRLQPAPPAGYRHPLQPTLPHQQAACHLQQPALGALAGRGPVAPPAPAERGALPHPLSLRERGDEGEGKGWASESGTCIPPLRLPSAEFPTSLLRRGATRRESLRPERTEQLPSPVPSCPGPTWPGTQGGEKGLPRLALGRTPLPSSKQALQERLQYAGLCSSP